MNVSDGLLLSQRKGSCVQRAFGGVEHNMFFVLNVFLCLYHVFILIFVTKSLAQDGILFCVCDL